MGVGTIIPDSSPCHRDVYITSESSSELIVAFIPLDYLTDTCRADLYGKIGNGGLSLRKVESFAAACCKYSEQIEQSFSRGGHLNNEDVFWATVPQEFRYPEWQEALGFAIDTNPKYCYNLRQQQLPMGCHSWSKPRMWKFWKDIIKEEAV